MSTISELIENLDDLIRRRCRSLSAASLSISLIVISNSNRLKNNIKLLEILLKIKELDLNHISEKKSLIIHLIECDFQEEKIYHNILINLIKENKIEQENLNISLFYAISLENLDLVKAIIEKGACLNYKYNMEDSNRKSTPLKYAKELKLEEITKYLERK